MKVLIIGATGYLGPHVVKALEDHHQLLLTDIKPPKENTPHPFQRVDVSSMEQVQRAAEGMDAILNLSVLREHRRIAFDVNSLGCYNIMRAAVDHGIRRVINTGPHFTITGPLYEGIDHGITPDVPPHPSTILYALTKSLGQEICRVFSQHHDVYVLDYLFYNFRDPKQVKAGLGRGALHRLLGRRRRSLPPWPGDRTGPAALPLRNLLHFRGYASREVSQRKDQTHPGLQAQGRPGLPLAAALTAFRFDIFEASMRLGLLLSRPEGKLASNG